MSRLTIVSIVLTVVLIGIPTAANFYPPIFAGLARQVPLSLILTWMSRLGILILGVMAGWYARGEWKEDVSDETSGGEASGTGDTIEMSDTAIEGCIEVDGSCWKGTAELSEGELVETEVSYKAICPKCQTIMYDGEDGPAVAVATMGGGPDYWDCPNCSHRTIDSIEKYKDAKKLFSSDIQRIVESQDEDYSLDNLADRIDGEVTPRGIWEEYTKVVDDEHVSLNCFH